MSAETLLKYPLALLTGLCVTFLLTPMIRRLASGLGFVDRPDARRVNAVPIPRCGGIAIFLGFHCACAAVFLLPWASFDSKLTAVWWWNFLLVSSLVLALGLADDARSLRPFLKLAGQIACALIAYAFDMRVGKVLGFYLPPALDIAATVLWFTAIVNAFNLIDGIDGLATGLACIAAAGMGGALAFRHLPGDTLVTLGLAGACLAFLRFNFHPASIFLGDSGSMFLGFTLAAIALSTGSKDTAIASLVVPLLAMGVPVFDTAMAIWRRSVRRALSRNASGEGQVFTADLDHIHHRLLRRGIPQDRAAMWLYAASVILVAVGLLSLVFQAHAVGIYLIAFVAAAFVALRQAARIELWDSGLMLLRGALRPPRRAIGVVLQPLADFALLALALAIATHFTLPDEATRWKTFWFDQIPIWAGIPLLFIVLSGAYSRLWNQARVSEYMGLAAMLIAGVLVAAGLSVLVGQFSAGMEVTVVNPTEHLTVVMGRTVPHSLWMQVLIMCAVVLILVPGLRLVPRAIQDAMIWERLRRPDPSRPVKHVLLIGAGNACTLFLIEHSFRSPDQPAPYVIVGLIDDNPELHHCRVHGYRVLGGIDALPLLIPKFHVESLILTEPLEPGRLQRLAETSRGIELLKWKTSLRHVEAGRGPIPA